MTIIIHKNSYSTCFMFTDTKSLEVEHWAFYFRFWPRSNFCCTHTVSHKCTVVQCCTHSRVFNPDLIFGGDGGDGGDGQSPINA